MWLDLSKIIEIPGAEKRFAVTLDPERLTGPSVLRFTVPPEADGKVVNTAGLLDLRATVRADMLCVCDRCGKQFDREKTLHVDVPLIADAAEDDEVGPDAFELSGDGIDVSEVLETCFLLDLETKLLCRNDCRGLCPRCGRDLNEGPCGCAPEKDARFAVLAELLDDKD
jgi:uncharacterized protein